MSECPASARRVVYLGTGGTFSSIPLRGLLAMGAEVCAVVVPGAGPARERGLRLPVTQPSGRASVVDLALQTEIPVEYVERCDAAGLPRRLGAYAPDVVLVACFPWLLPAEVLALPRHGCFNLHPSLLPAYRGPAPLFWQFYFGERETGVTLHRMTLKVDAGGIVAQRRVDLPEGVSGPEAEVLLAGVGGQLMLAMLAHLAVGHLLLTAQDEARQSYQPWPTERNFRLSPEWAARRAFNFIRGTRHWGRHYVLELTAESFLIAEALFYDEQARLDQPYMLAGTELHVQCTPGVLVVRLADGM